MSVTEQTTVTLRPFQTADYDAITRIFNANFAPDFEKDPDEIRRDDAQHPDYVKWARWVVDRNGTTVGYCDYEQPTHVYHPRRFELTIMVDPTHYLEGIGGMLYKLLMSELTAFDPESVGEWAREDMRYRTGFFERRGFVPNMRMWTSTLDLKTFEPKRFAHATPAVEGQGIQLKSLAELGPWDPEVRQRLYDLWREAGNDVPIPAGEERTEISYEMWLERSERHRSNLWPEGYFVAVDGERYVGLSQLWLSPVPDTLRTGLTGVRRAYRRRGIALALKVRALTVAKERGYRLVNTENESNNAGMLGINADLGFVRKPAWIHYSKILNR
jgi:mycothiol synthase